MIKVTGIRSKSIFEIIPKWNALMASALSAWRNSTQIYERFKKRVAREEAFGLRLCPSPDRRAYLCTISEWCVRPDRIGAGISELLIQTQLIILHFPVISTKAGIQTPSLWKQGREWQHRNRFWIIRYHSLISHRLCASWEGFHSILSCAHPFERVITINNYL